jgi:hypothetical protein
VRRRRARKDEFDNAQENADRKAEKAADLERRT